MSFSVQTSTAVLNPVNRSITSTTRLGAEFVNIIDSYLGYLTREEVQRFLVEAPARLLTPPEVVRLPGSLRTSLREYAHSMNTEQFPLFPAIRECCCRIFNRKSRVPIISEFRSALEEITIDRIKQLYPNKREPLRVASLGSGGCFQELIYIAKLLLREGYTNIHFDLIDTCYATANEFGSNASVDALQRCLQEYLSTAITITVHTDLQTYLGQIEPSTARRPHVFLMIDLNIAESLVHTVLDSLQRNPSSQDVLTTFTQGNSAACFTIQELLRTFPTTAARNSLTSQMSMISFPGTSGQTTQFLSVLGVLQGLGLASSSQDTQETA